VPARRLIATADMPAGPTDAEVKPGLAEFQTFLAAERFRGNVANGLEMRAMGRHDSSLR
jgi:hypothetical protein